MYDKEYTYQDYLNDLEKEANKGKITYKFQRMANKSHFCEQCGCEIHKNEHVWWYKPYPTKDSNGKVKWYKWRTRCFDHEPMKYDKTTFNEEVSESCYQDNGYGRW